MMEVQSKPVFKRFWFWMLILLAAIIGVTVFIVLRGGPGGPGGDPMPGDVNYAVNEPAVFRELRITATDFRESEGDEEAFLLPEAGNVFLGARFEIENTSEGNLAIDQHSLFEFAHVNGEQVQFSLPAALTFQGDGEDLNAVLEPGQRLTGWFAVEVPADWDVFTLRLRNNWTGLQNATFVFGDESALEQFETAPYVPEADPVTEAEPPAEPAETLPGDEPGDENDLPEDVEPGDEEPGEPGEEETV